MSENIGTRNDASMDLASMLHQSTKSHEVSNQSEVTGEDMNVTAKASVTPEEFEQNLSREQKDIISGGIVVPTEEAGASGQQLRPMWDSDERRKAFDDAVNDQERMIFNAQHVVITRRPENLAEEQKLIHDISRVVVTESGEIIIPEDAPYILPKTEEVMQRIAALENGEENDEGETSTASNEILDEESVVASIKKDVKERIVKIIIDKTGLGANIELDTNEQAEVYRANQIHLIEVEDKALKVTEVKRPDENIPLLDCIDTYQLSVSKCPVVFPGSGFKAEMCGLSFGEFSDITFDITDEDGDDYLSFDKVHRRLSTVYNKMINVSTGKFLSFDEFLKKFAYVDIQYAIFGLLVATQPENDVITLVCTNPHKTCRKRFDYSYVPRSIIDFDTAGKFLLEAMDRILDATPKDRMEVLNNSRVNKFFRFELPRCKYIVDLGLVSCYDYLYKILSLLNEYDAKQKSGEMADDDTRIEVVQMLMGVRRVLVPQKSGGYVEITEPSDIVNLITMMPPDDVQVLNAAYEKYVGQLSVEFSLKNIKCPHCGHFEKRAAITPDELVFLVHQRQRATRVAFDNFQDF